MGHENGGAFNSDQRGGHHENSKREPKLLKDMTEPELRKHFDFQLQFLRSMQTPDTIGCMLVVFQDNGIAQYGATVDPETAPAALRELADRIEKRQTVTR